MQRHREVADLARRGERRPPLEIPAAIACATSRSSTTGRETLRANANASTSAPTSAISPADEHVALRAAHDLVETCAVLTETRTKPSGCRTAT